MGDFQSGELLANLFGVPATVPEVSGEGSLAPSWDTDCIDWPEPCPTCGSLEKWWDWLGRERCQRCEADTLARGLRILRPLKRAL